MQRFLVLWFPDWPAQAVRKTQNVPETRGPVVVTGTGKDRTQVWVCSAEARHAGVRRGMLLRHAQALCPMVYVASHDEERDARAFEPVLAALDQVAASVEVLRPGLVVIDAAAAARYHGSEDKAAQLLIDASATAGIDSCVGIADELFTAVLAARTATVVPPGVGNGRAFLAPLPMGLLSAEEALGCDRSTVASLRSMGITTLGDLAALPYKKVVTRFGSAGQHCHDIAHARPGRKIAPPPSTVDLRVSYEPDDPITRVDTAAFLARHLASTLHHSLAAAGVECRVLAIQASLTTGEHVHRVWRTREAITEQGTADRVRWQLDGWLSARRAGASTSSGDDCGVVQIVLDPVECCEPGQDSADLWGMRSEKELAVQRVISRVQSTLGTDAVLQPRHVGGRGPGERIDCTPYGEEHPYPRNPDGRWPGRIPGPHPGRLGGKTTHSHQYVTLLAANNDPIIVTTDIALSAAPARLHWGQKSFTIRAWAGPWGVNERWWTPKARTYARLQIVGSQDETYETAWLLQWCSSRWRIEGIYN